MNTPLRRVSLAVMALILLLLGQATWIQVVKADEYRADPRNQRVLLDEYARQRGQISAGGEVMARSVESPNPGDRLRYLRQYTDGPMYAPVTGYYSQIYGSGGMERAMDPVLNGTDDRLFVRRISDAITGRDPAGGNVVLTIDPRIQQAAYDAMTSRGYQGSVVAIRPQTGEILAMVSLPTYDNNKFARGISSKDFSVYLDDPDKPLRNHAIADIYPPGSTYKLVTALSALEEGVTDPTRLWPTYGCYQIPDAPAGDCLFDWNKTGFGPVNLVSAFALSSDTFFYQMAIKVGIDRLAAWAGQLGFGKPTGIRLPGEASGTVPSTRWAQEQGRAGVFTGEVAQAGIGQNVIAVTPLQLLNAYAALANGGTLMRPMIVRGETDRNGKLTRPYPPEALAKVAADPANLHTLRIAAREVITSGHAYNISELKLPGTLSGKTGTAEFGEPNPDGSLPFHSWFVAYLPTAPGAADAKLAVITFSYAALVPGNVSAEVVKYFLQKYFKLKQDLRLDPRDFSLVAAN